MDQLEENQNSTLISPPLVARTNVRCQLSFLYYYGSDNDACQLSVEQQTHRGVYNLWSVTTYSETVERASVDVPCSDTDYKILIVGKKLASTGCHHLDVHNIDIKLSTLPTTTEGATFSSLPRRVSFTSFTSLETTTASSSTPEVSVPSDRQTEDEEGLNTGKMVAIVVVAVVVVVIAVILIVIVVVRRRNGAKRNQRAPGLGSGASQAVTNAGYRPEQANPARSPKATDMHLTPVNLRGGLTNQNNADIPDDSLTTQTNQYEPISHGTDESRPYETLTNQRNIYEAPTNDNRDDKPYDTLFACTRITDGYELPVAKTALGKPRKQNDANHAYNN
ncbi:uncharacterized protein [Littorina saxatilis]|uniref:uncharacterized protein isoform X1 n=1 Tax=Littorina saxatilis TaxID=31220 RepID=UPI0038B4B8A6